MAARTVEERIAIIDEKISKKKAEIKALETQKQRFSLFLCEAMACIRQRQI